MSSFNGRVVELPGVIVDHFVGSNAKEGHFFFLSHCHKGGGSRNTPPQTVQVKVVVPIQTSFVSVSIS